MTPLLDEITTQEERVLLLIGDGCGLGEIAAILSMTERQVRRRRDRARSRLNAPTTTAAVVRVVLARSSRA